MKISAAHLKNFKCFEEAKFTFARNFNLIVGVNGAGKTSLLEALSFVFTDSGYQKKHFYNTSIDEQAFSLDDFIRYGKTSRGMERKHPLNLKIWDEEKNYLDFEIDRTEGSFTNCIVGDLLENFHIFSFYKSTRNWPIKKINLNSSIMKWTYKDGYYFWYDASSNADNFFSWITGRCIASDVAKGKGRYNPDDYHELDTVNAAISACFEGAKGFTFDDIESNLALEFEDGSLHSFDSLSDGQKTIAALIGDIARRACLLNPNLGKDVLNETQGIVFIDELDLHLHPKWQRSIVQCLKTIFPNIQFFATSHSPLIIGEMRPNEIVLLDNYKQVQVGTSYGLTVSQVIEKIMGVPERIPAVQTKINALFDSLSEAESTDEISFSKNLLEDLRRVVGDTTEVKEAEEIIRTLEEA